MIVIRTTACYAALACLVLPVLATATEAPADTVHVLGKAPALGCEVHLVDQSDTLADQLAGTPFELVRRGAGAVADLYADGLKRGDITVTVDGERHTTACPNRMDTRAGHVNLMGIERLELDRTGSGLAAGLGGSLQFRRRAPGVQPLVQGVLRASAGHAEGHELGVAAEADRLRTSLRYRRWQPYTEANDRNFNRLYGYAIAPSSAVYEGQVMKAWDHGDAVLTAETSLDVLFPYLKMDERENQHYQASVSQDGHRFYVNHNDHVMDNALRTSARMTDMRTAATNTMLGLGTEFFELYARNWDADNRIIPVANPAMGIHNHMLPDVWRVYASVRHELSPAPWLTLAGRVGVAHTSTGDNGQFKRHLVLEPEAENSRLSVPFGLTATTAADLSSQVRWTMSAEVSSDAVGIEELYISVDKPGNNPTWLGNPELADPVRATLRTELRHRHLRCELFGSRIWNDSRLVRRQVAGQAYQTYENGDAVILGANAGLTTRHLDAGLVWNWAADTDDWDPLAEIQPLTTQVVLKVPDMGPLASRLSWEHAITQDRVDTSLGERTTPAWDRVDLSLTAELGHWDLNATVENLLNESYARHLSYQRNPFASGLAVLEPGRTLVLTAAFQY